MALERLLRSAARRLTHAFMEIQGTLPKNLERIARALRVQLPQIFQVDLVEGDRSRIERQPKIIALTNALKPTDLALAISILQLLARRARPDRSI